MSLFGVARFVLGKETGLVGKVALKLIDHEVQKARIAAVRHWLVQEIKKLIEETYAAKGRWHVGPPIVNMRDPEDIAKEIMRGDEYRDFLAERLADALLAAREATPVRTGAHRDALFVTVDVDDDGVPHGYLGSTSPTWHLIEFGGAFNSPSASMRTGVARAGLEYRPEPKP